MKRQITLAVCTLAATLSLNFTIHATPPQNATTDVPGQQASQPPPPTGAAPSGTVPGLPDLPLTTATPAATPEGLDDSAFDFWGQDTLTGNWGGLRTKLANAGVKFTPLYTAEVFGNPSGGAGKGVISDGLLDLVLDLNLDQMSDSHIFDGMEFHTDALWIYGPGLSSSFVGDFSNTSNIAGYNTIRLQELWLQKQFWEKRLSIRVGNLPVDTEFFQSTSASLFINGTFGAFTLIGNNVPNAPVYPVASPGVRFQFTPVSNFYVMAGVYGMDNNSVQDVNNKNGTRFALNPGSGMLVMTEAGYLLNQSPNDRGLQGTYRIGSWLDTGNTYTWDSQAQDANGTGSLRSGGANYGVYGVMDQQIYASGPQVISLFVRSGGAPSNTNFVDWYAEGGFNFTGFIPGRNSDVAGLAIARSHVSRDFGTSQVEQGGLPLTAETVIEATYKMQLNTWWSIQPDFQYIITPSAVQGSPNAVVLGLRTDIAF